MGDVLGIGITHYPRLAGPDATMSGTLKALVSQAGFPDELKDPANWPPEMAAEWADDEGAVAAGRHRSRLVDGLRSVRRALDKFRPDAVVIWGDDQYENFKEDVIPAFAVLACDSFQTTWGSVKYGPNVWTAPTDGLITVAGARGLAKALTTGLLGQGFDVAYAYETLHEPGLSHAFLNSVLYLDWDRTGFPYRVVPVAVNCYGRRVISQRGLLPRFDAQPGEDSFDPPSPSPRRCYELGRATARIVQELDIRVALCASASWSHAFLTAKHGYLYPDTPADLRLYRAMLGSDYEEWAATPLAAVEESGQQELLNWFCLVGAMAELGHRVTWSDFVTTHLFNSNKAFAVFGTGGPT